jgi:hypothetical protein
VLCEVSRNDIDRDNGKWDDIINLLSGWISLAEDFYELKFSKNSH